MSESDFITKLTTDEDFKECRLMVGTNSTNWEQKNETYFAWVPWTDENDENDMGLGYLFIKNNGFQFNFRPTQQTILYKVELPITFDILEKDNRQQWLLHLELSFQYSSSNNQWTELNPIFNFDVSMDKMAFNYFSKWCREIDTITDKIDQR